MAWYDITGTIADWVMAGSAVYAAVNAKRWFSQRSHTKGFDKAEELLAEIDRLFNYTDKMQADLQNFWDYLEQSEKNTIKLNDSQNAYFVSLIDELTKHRNNIINLIQDAKLIERWSIRMKNSDVVFNVLLKLHEAFCLGMILYSAFKLHMNALSDHRDLENNGIDLLLRKNYREANEATSAVMKPYKILINLKFTQLFAIK